MNNCIFCKIIDQQIPAKIVYEDSEVLVFNDIQPKAEIHWLIIPKRHITSMLELTESDQALCGKMLVLANQLAKEHGLTEGYKVQVNTGVKGGQEVFHLHIHVLGNY